MPKRGYRGLSIPDGLYRELEQYLERSKGRYVSISEIVREAIREYLKKNSNT